MTWEECVNQEKDAARYRWLINKLQEAYEDGATLESESININCSMSFGRKEVRYVQSEINWFDERDEPLNLSSAIDKAMEREEANTVR